MNESRKPANSKFKQQQLAAWQPILTPKTVIPSFAIVGVIFLIIGPLLLSASNSVVESELLLYQDKLALASNQTVTIKIPAKMTKPVYMYYQLTNYYQNHRRYVKSRNDAQLAGREVTYDDLEDCEPLRSVSGSKDPKDFYYPCGLIAASLFNDTFTQLKDPNGKTITLKKEGIAWPSDKDVKFKKPSTVQGVPPKDYSGPTPFDVTDEDFIVWMRTAGLPKFRKLYRIIDQDLEAGDYTVLINNNFPVKSFSGTKGLVLSTASWIGGKNSFLGTAYTVVGALCLLLAIAFYLKHLKSPRSLGDTQYIVWNRNM